jgi:long-chain acyl-CoA synthetase
MTDTMSISRDTVTSYLDEIREIEPTSGADGLTDRIVDELLAAGVGDGHVVLIMLANGTPLLRCFFGVLFAGAVPVLLAPGTPPGRIREIAHRMHAVALIDPAGSGPDPDGHHRTLGPARFRLFPSGELRRHRAGDVIILTSGTSGVASGCLHRLSSLTRNAERHATAVGLRADDTMLVNLPLNFSYALVAQALAGLLTGARLVITGPPFTPAAYLTALRDHGITSSSITPYMARAMVAADWSPPPSLRMLTVGGDSLGPAVTAELRHRAPELELYLTYGLTEAGPRVSTLAAHREPQARLSSVGLPLPGVGVALRDPGPDGVGELTVTSDTVLRAKVGTEEGRSGDCLIGPGTIATGDLFRRDDDGYLYFQGRLSDFVVAGGGKVSLASVRRIANAVPGVVTSATRVYRTGDGPRFDLDVYLRDADDEAADRIRRTLLPQLLRSEWPARIRALSLRDMGHK